MNIPICSLRTLSLWMVRGLLRLTLQFWIARTSSILVELTNLRAIPISLWPSINTCIIEWSKPFVSYCCGVSSGFWNFFFSWAGYATINAGRHIAYPTFWMNSRRIIVETPESLCKISSSSPLTPKWGLQFFGFTPSTSCCSSFELSTIG